MQDISKAVGEMWSKTTDEEKEKYVKLAQEDKERYQKALENFNNLKRESSLENMGASSWVRHVSEVHACTSQRRVVMTFTG